MIMKSSGEELPIVVSRYCRSASTAITMVTSSPVDAAFLVMPNSERLTVAVTSAPHTGVLVDGWIAHLNPDTVRAQGLVTPRIVSSPSAPTTALPSNLTLLDLKVMVGNCATLK